MFHSCFSTLAGKNRGCARARVRAGCKVFAVLFDNYVILYTKLLYVYHVIHESNLWRLISITKCMSASLVRVKRKSVREREEERMPACRQASFINGTAMAWTHSMLKHPTILGAQSDQYFAAAWSTTWIGTRKNWFMLCFQWKLVKNRTSFAFCSCDGI